MIRNCPTGQYLQRQFKNDRMLGTFAPASGRSTSSLQIGFHDADTGIEYARTTHQRIVSISPGAALPSFLNASKDRFVRDPWRPGERICFSQPMRESDLLEPDEAIYSPRPRLVRTATTWAENLEPVAVRRYPKRRPTPYQSNDAPVAASSDDSDASL